MTEHQSPKNYQIQINECNIENQMEEMNNSIEELRLGFNAFLSMGTSQSEKNKLDNCISNDLLASIEGTSPVMKKRAILNKPSEIVLIEADDTNTNNFAIDKKNEHSLFFNKNNLNVLEQENMASLMMRKSPTENRKNSSKNLNNLRRMSTNSTSTCNSINNNQSDLKNYYMNMGVNNYVQNFNQFNEEYDSNNNLIAPSKNHYSSHNIHRLNLNNINNKKMATHTKNHLSTNNIYQVNKNMTVSQQKFNSNNNLLNVNNLNSINSINGSPNSHTLNKVYDTRSFMYGKSGWVCCMCKNFNFEMRTVCNRCGKVVDLPPNAGNNNIMFNHFNPHGSSKSSTNIKNMSINNNESTMIMNNKMQMLENINNAQNTNKLVPSSPISSAFNSDSSNSEASNSDKASPNNIPNVNNNMPNKNNTHRRFNSATNCPQVNLHSFNEYNQQKLNTINNMNVNYNDDTQEEAKKKKPFVERPGDWACVQCKNMNFSFRMICNRCKLTKIESDMLFNQYMQNLTTYMKAKELLSNTNSTNNNINNNSFPIQPAQNLQQYCKSFVNNFDVNNTNEYCEDYLYTPKESKM